MRIGIVGSDDVSVSALRDLLGRGPAHEVIWAATNGAEAAVRCRRHRPDLVVVDMSTPGSDSVGVVRGIMSEAPLPILLVVSTGQVNPSDVFRAMSHGALDAVMAPILEGGVDASGASEFIEKIDRLARLVGVDNTRPGRYGSAPAHAPSVIIGASSGGPAALAKVLSELPADLASAVIVIQHVEAQFAEGLAEWLSEFSSLPVRVIEAGERPRPGTVFLACTNDHLVQGRGGRFEYVSEPEDAVYRPSIDVFAASVAASDEPPGVAVLLTGIGRDGAAGLLELRLKGWHTIAQDETTSVVYGMPRAAAAMGAAVEVLELDRIAAAIVHQLSASDAGH